MFKTTVGETLKALPMLNKITQLVEERKMPFSVSFKSNEIGSVANRINSASSENAKIMVRFSRGFDAENDKDLTSLDIIIVKKEPRVIIDKDNMKKKLEELYAMEINILNFTPFTHEELNSLEGVTLADIKNLGKFLEDNKPIEDKSEKIEIVFDDEEKE